MSAIAQSRRISPLRHFSHEAMNQKLEEISAILREIQQSTAESRGLSGGDAVTLGRHLDMQGNRMQHVGRTRAETDAPNVRELREHGLYAREDGIHETQGLIFARGGVRTVTPAIAPNDLITKGQVERLISGVDVGVSQNNLGSSTDATTVSSADAAWAWPQTAVTLPNGLTSDWQLPGAVFLRITGPTAPFSIGGFRDVDDGRYLILMNATVQDLTLVNEDAATPAAHRITTGTSGDVTMSGRGTTNLIYATAEARWWLL